MVYFILEPNVTENAQVRTSPNTLKLALYHVPIKAGTVCRKAVQVCIIPKHDLTLPHKWFIFSLHVILTCQRKQKMGRVGIRLPLRCFRGLRVGRDDFSLQEN